MASMEILLIKRLILKQSGGRRGGSLCVSSANLLHFHVDCGGRDIPSFAVSMEAKQAGQEGISSILCQPSHLPVWNAWLPVTTRCVVKD